MHDIGFATSEWQRDSILRALDGATYQHGWWGASWPGHRRVRYSEERPLRVKMVRTTWCGAKVWMFRVTNREAYDAGRTIIERTAHGWFQTGDRVVFAARMADGTPAGTPARVVGKQAGDLYVVADGEPQATKECWHCFGLGSAKVWTITGHDYELCPTCNGLKVVPDLSHTPMVGPWWLDRP